VISRLQELRTPDQTCYCEPFWGAGNIGMACCEKLQLPIWANDKDVALMNLWRSVQSHPDELISIIEQYQPCPEDFFEFKKQLESEVFEPRFSQIQQLDSGFKKLACHQLSFGGCGEAARGPIGGREQKSQWKVDSRWSPSRLIKKIRELHKKFQSLEIKFTSLDFKELLSEPTKMLIYLDPPYPTFTKNDRVYRLMLEEHDHIEMAKLLRSTHHTWLLSNEQNSMIYSLYDWATVKELSINYSLSKKVKSELLVCL